MRFENTEVFNFEGALRGMRNPKESWHLSDSRTVVDFIDENSPVESYKIGPKDMGLAQRLIAAGTEHRKFLRQIFVSVDITAPVYWWGEFDTYKIGTTANSTSKMHKLASKPITMNMFEIDDYELDGNDDLYECCTDAWASILTNCEFLRNKFLETGDKRYWKELVRMLPESWLQTRTVTMNYENLRSMYFQRKNHKLTEWSESFCDWIKTLPYAEELIMFDGSKDSLN